MIAKMSLYVEGGGGGGGGGECLYYSFDGNIVVYVSPSC